MPGEERERVTAHATPPSGAGPGPSASSAAHEGGTPEPAAAPPAAGNPRRRWLRWLLGGAVLLAVLTAGLIWGVPYVRAYFNTVSTDDAYVNSHVTMVAPRIEDNVVEVLVDDGYFVQRGTPLVKLDRYPYELAVQQKRAAFDVAQAQLEETIAKVRSEEAQGRAAWYQLTAAQDQVRSQLANLRANLANLELAESNRTYARGEVTRVSRLTGTGAATQEELEQRRNALSVAESQVTAAREAIQQTRANLGLERNERDPLQVPANLEETYSAVQVALSNAAVALAQIGVNLQLHNLTPKKLYEQLLEMSPSRDLNQTLDTLVDRAPETILARAQVEAAQKDLEQAELNLSYTVIKADVDGFVNRRNVNPGDHVLKGQNLMALRSFQEVWIDANFKETQLNDIVIGQPVDISVDAYPGRVFRGRVAGFSPATGAVSALLPAENATGNFVKIVQRLPVRIELTEPNPPDTPLFAGLSVTPTVRIHDRPEGPNAGKRIREEWKEQAPAQPATPPGTPGATQVPHRTNPGQPIGQPPPIRQGAGPVMP